MEPGKNSTEFWWLKVLGIATVAIAVASSMGKVPFTPEQVGGYLSGVMSESGEYIKVLSPYIALISGYYMWLRTSLKKKKLETDAKPQSSETV